MDSSAGKVELSGNVGLVDQKMSFTGKATLMPGGGGAAAGQIISSVLSAATNNTVSGITVPFSIGGTLSNPTFLPGKGIPGVAGNSPGDSKSVKTDAITTGIQSCEEETLDRLTAADIAGAALWIAGICDQRESPWIWN
jgi:hypothetical protein